MRRIIIYLIGLLLVVGLGYISYNQLNTNKRLKAQVQAQTEIIKHQNKLIDNLTSKPTYQIKTEVRVGKKATINNLTTSPEIVK